MTLQDTYQHKGLRKALVKIVSQKGITNKDILAALLKVPRHLFFDNAFMEFAYQDKAFPIGSGQTISQPFTVAFQSQLLNLKKGEKVLEIGTGSGYQTAILLELGVKVLSVERQKKLFSNTKAMLTAMNYRPKLFFGDGFQGLPTYAPFDKIIVTAGAPDIPKELIKQLKPGGIMVIPVDRDDSQIMYKLTKSTENDEYEIEEHGNFLFVPMLKNRATD